MNRMAVAGREILRWLSEPFVLSKNRTDFETLLFRIGEAAEDWISSAEGMRLSRATPPPRHVFAGAAPPYARRSAPPVFEPAR